MKTDESGGDRVTASVEQAMTLQPGWLTRSTILEEVPWDSLNWAEVTLLIEDTVGVAMDPERLRDCITWGDLLDLLVEEAR